MRAWVRLLLISLISILAFLPLPGLLAQDKYPAREWYVGKILFKSDRSGSEGLYAINPDGTGLTLLEDPNAPYYYAEAKERDVLSADGRYRLFVREFGNDNQIWQEDLETGNVSYIVGGVPGADYEPAWAPDNRWVAYVSQVDSSDEIHVFDRVTATDKRLTENPWEWDKHPSWSPDGKQIVFWSNRQGAWKHIWIMNADGGDQHNISGWQKGNDWDPVWVKEIPSEPGTVFVDIATDSLLPTEPGCTPDPEDYVGKILFKSDREGTAAIYLLDPQSGETCRVDDPDVGFYYAEAQKREALTPDGRYRLFVKQIGRDYQIWVEDTKTLDASYVTGGTAGADYEPAFGADSRLIVYVSQVDGNDEIYLYDRTTEELKRLTENQWEWDKHPSWSPNGEQIVFWSNRESLWKNLWIMNADGSAQHNLGGWGNYNDWDPIWVKAAPSPAPAIVIPEITPIAPILEQKVMPREWYVGKILFKSDRDGGEAIYAMNPDGSDIQRITDPNVAYYYSEALEQDTISSDGRYRLFVRQVGNDTQIWQQDLETSEIAYIVGGMPGADYEPAWAPDSRWVAYVSQVDGNDEIHLYDRNNQQDRRLTQNTWEWDKHPSWSPDGEQIVFWSNRESLWKHIWVMNADGSEQHNISGWLEANDWDPVWVKQLPSER